MNYLLKYIVPTLLGDYISGMDSDSITTSYFSGEVSLKNISLKKDLFTKKGIPLDIVYSNLGNLELKIPWLNVSREPILVTVRDLFLVVTLSDPQKIDPIRQRIFFMNKISRACYDKTQSLDNQNDNKGWFSAMKINILDNLQVSLKNVHIRFEDPERNTISGFILDDFSVLTTNENWEQEFLDRTLEINRMKNLCKRAAISNLSSYCIIENDKSKFLVNPAFTDEYRLNCLKAQTESILQQNTTKDKEDNLMFKMSAELKIVMKNKNLESDEDPKFFTLLEVEQLKMTLRHQQVDSLLNSLECAANIGKLIEHRPPEITQEEKASKQKEFGDLLKTYLKSRKDEEADWLGLYDNDKTMLGVNFRKYLVVIDDETMIICVNEAILSIGKENLALAQNKKTGFFAFFTMKKTEITEQQATIADKFLEQLIQKNEEKLDKMNTGFLFQICLRIQNFGLFVINQDPKKDIKAGVALDIHGFECKFESWKKADAEVSLFTTKIDQFLIFLKTKVIGTDYYKRFNIIKRIDSQDNPNNKAIFELEVKKEVTMKTQYLNIKGEVQELVVNYLAAFFYQVFKFTRFESRVHSLEQMAIEEMDSLAIEAQKNFTDFMNLETKLEIFIDFKVVSPKIVIPLQQNGDLETDIWLMSLGNIHITTPKNTKYDERIYHVVGTSVSGISLKYFTRWRDWMERNVQAEHHVVLEDTKFNLVTCLMQSDAKRTSKSAASIVTCEFEPIVLNTSKTRLKKFFQLLHQLDFTQDNEFHELLVTERTQIMQTKPPRFWLEFGEDRNFKSIGLFYEYYLYLYKESTSLIPTKVIRLIQQKFDFIQNEDYYTIEVTDPTEIRKTHLTFQGKANYENFMAVLHERIALGKEILEMRNLNLKAAIAQLDKEKEIESADNCIQIAKANDNAILMELEVMIPKLSIRLQSDQSKFLIEIGLMKLANSWRDLETSFSFSTASLLVNAETKNKTVHNLISNERFETSKLPYKETPKLNLFSLTLSIYKQNHPHFVSTGCKSHLDGIYDSLYVFWKPILISEIVYSIADIFAEKRNEDAKMNLDSSTIRKENEILKRMQVDELSSALQKTKAPVFDSMNIKIAGLFISLFTPKTEIEMASISLKNLETAIIKDIEKIRIRGQLENLSIVDLTNYPYTISDNKSPTITINELFGVDKASKSLLEFDVIMYPEYHPKLIDQKVTLIKVNLHSVIINYMQQPVLRILDYVMNYFMNIEVQKLIAPDGPTLEEAREQITNPKFKDVKVKVENTKVILRAHPTVTHWFELDVGLLEVSNSIVTHRNRLNECVKSLKFTYNEHYSMHFKQVTLNKVISDKTRTQLSNRFDFYLGCEMALFIKEYCALVNDELKSQKMFAIDDGYKLTGQLRVVELNLSRQAYVEMMDAAFHNLLNDDFKDYLYCFRPHLLKEELPIIRWRAKDSRTDFLIESISLTFWDENRKAPIARVQANQKKISFTRTEEFVSACHLKFYELQIMKFDLVAQDEVRMATILSISAFSDIQTTKMISNKTFKINPDLTLGCLQKEEKEADLSKMIAKQAGNAEYDSKNISIAVYVHNKRKNIHVDILNMKAMIHLEDLLRIFDFCNYVPVPLLEDDDSLKVSMAEVSKNEESASMAFTLIANESHFCIPSGEKHALIFKANFDLNYYAQDLQQIIVNSTTSDMKLEELYSCSLKLQQAQLMVVPEIEFVSELPLTELTRRIIIHPFNLTCHLNSKIARDESNKNTMALFQTDDVSIDQLAARIAYRDLSLLIKSTDWINQRWKAYRKITPFSFNEPEYKRVLSQRKQDQDNYFASWKIEQATHDVSVITQGIQIRLINETQKYSLPLMDLTVISDSFEPSLTFSSMKGSKEIKCNFHLSSNYFNTNHSFWEPFVENFAITLKINSNTHKSPNLSFSIDVKNPLNVNLSDQLIDSALTTILEWKQRYETDKSQELANSRGKKSIAVTSYVPESNVTNLNRTESISPYLVQNLTGYPIAVIPNEKNVKVELMEDETRDICFEKNIEELFLSQTEKNSFITHNEVTVLLNYPDSPVSRSKTIVIDDISITEVRFPDAKTVKPRVYCEISNQEKKRCITFTSSVQIKNEFNIPFDVNFFRRDGTKLISKILLPEAVVSVPFDLVDEFISIAPSYTNSRKSSDYAITDILNKRQVELVLPGDYCKLRVSNFAKYSVIRIAPILRIKNCLPVNLDFEVSNKEVGETRKQTGSLKCQESGLVSALSLQDSLYLRVGILGHSASAKLLISNGKSNLDVSKIALKGSTGPIELAVYRPQDDADQIIIYSEACIVNETGIPLLYYLENRIPFPGSSELNAKGIVVFDHIKEMRIQSLMAASPKDFFTEVVPLGLGDRSVELKMGEDTSMQFNLGLKISSQLCDRGHNLMTKVVSIAPRYLVLNETQQTILVVQDQSEAMAISAAPNGRVIWHFMDPKLRKFLRFKIKTEKNEIGWCWSGAIDCTASGEYVLMMTDEKRLGSKHFKVSISLESPTFYVQIFEQTNDEAKIRILNNLDCLDLMISQEGDSNMSVKVPRNKWSSFAWSEPCDQKNIVTLLLIDGLKGDIVASNNYSLDKIGEEFLLLSNYKHKDKIMNVLVEVSLEGATKILRVFTQRLKEPSKTWNVQGSLTIQTAGCSAIHGRGKERVEMVYVGFQSVRMDLKYDKKKLELFLRIKEIKIDNNTDRNVLYPCVVYPFDKENNGRYTLDIYTSLNLSNEENKIKSFEKIKISFKGFAIKVETSLINMFLNFGKQMADRLRKVILQYNGFTEAIFFSLEEKEALAALSEVQTLYKWQLHKPVLSARSLVYIKELVVDPISLNLSFQNTKSKGTDEDIFTTFIKNSFLTLFVAFENKSLNLNENKLEGVCGKIEGIMEKLMKNYKSQAKDFALNWAAQSFLKKPISGTFGAIKSVSGTLAHGVSKLAVDKEYEASLEEAKSENNPNALTGLAQGFMSIGKSAFSGVTGVITKPVEGVQKGGFLGFFKGTGEGLAGLVAKPVSGTLNAVSKVAEGVTNTIKPISDSLYKASEDKLGPPRLRHPRLFYGRNKQIKAYSNDDILGHQIICNYKDGKFSQELVWIDSFVWNTQNQQPLKKESIGSFQDNAGYLMLIFDISLVFLVNLTQKKIVWVIAANDIDIAADLVNGILIKLKSSDKKIESDKVTIGISDEDLKSRILLRLKDYIALAKDASLENRDFAII